MDLQELLRTALNALDEKALTALLGPSFDAWLFNRMHPQPIQGKTLLWVPDQPIDCQAAVGRICQISRGGITNDIKDFAKSLGLFGIFCGWADGPGRTYVESVN